MQSGLIDDFAHHEMSEEVFHDGNSDGDGLWHVGGLYRWCRRLRSHGCETLLAENALSSWVPGAVSMYRMCESSDILTGQQATWDPACAHTMGVAAPLSRLQCVTLFIPYWMACCRMPRGLTASSCRALPVRTCLIASCFFLYETYFDRLVWYSRLIFDQWMSSCLLCVCWWSKMLLQKSISIDSLHLVPSHTYSPHIAYWLDIWIAIADDETSADAFIIVIFSQSWVAS